MLLPGPLSMRARRIPNAHFWVNASERGTWPKARARGCPPCYFSTDYVFDGEQPEPYREWDTPNPRSVYGHSKLAGEAELGRDQASTIVRISWVCGRFGNNMVKTILRLASEHETLRFVDDQRGCPTFADDLASMVRRLVVERRPGIFHVTNQGVASWYEFARDVLKAAGLDPSRVEPISTRDLDPQRPAPRPAKLGPRQHGTAYLGPSVARRLPGATRPTRLAAAGAVTTPTVGVVVIDHDGGELTMECLRSLVRTEWPPERLDVVLVDNASRSSVTDRVRHEMPGITVIESEVNRGFAGGCNLGIGVLTHADYIALLNNDATVDPAWLRPLVDARATRRSALPVPRSVSRAGSSPWSCTAKRRAAAGVIVATWACG